VARRAHRLATVLLAAVTAGGLLAAHAQSIAYTVQVVALSDREAALLVQTDLLRQGYPAYVVRSTSQQGDVFRVRVGAFANRQAAALYAEAMPPVSGGQPVPALAEGIPPGITPLAPSLLLQMAAREDALVYPWEGGFALRLPSGTGPAEYVLVSGSQVERHTAYLLGEREGARLWVRETSLYPPTWREETEAVNEGFRTSLVRLLAERLGVSVAEVEAAAFRPDPEEAPRLVVVELEAPEEPAGAGAACFRHGRARAARVPGHRPGGAAAAAGGGRHPGGAPGRAAGVGGGRGVRGRGGRPVLRDRGVGRALARGPRRPAVVRRRAPAGGAPRPAPRLRFRGALKGLRAAPDR